MIMDTQQGNVLDIGCKPVLEWAKNLHAAAFIRLRYSLCAISETVQQQNNGNR